VEQHPVKVSEPLRADNDEERDNSAGRQCRTESRTVERERRDDLSRRFLKAHNFELFKFDNNTPIEFVDRKGAECDTFCRTTPGGEVKLPGVERANHRSCANDSVSERTLAMRALTLGRKQFSVTLTKDRNAYLSDFVCAPFAKRNKVYRTERY
jgi:hypothetical protein